MTEEFKTKYIKHTFTEEEKREIASDLAQKINEKNELEQKKKEVAATIKAEIETAESQIAQLSTHYNQGYHHKNVKCRVDRNHETKTISYYRTDTGELVDSRRMTQDELQQGLFGEAS